MIKTRFFIALLLFISQVGFSQTEKIIQGKILCDNVPVMGVEVINLISKNTTITNDSGEFSIPVRPEDILVFFSKTYEYKKIYLDQEDIDKNIIISLTKKSEELKEVVITKRVLPVALNFDSKKIVDQNFEERSLSPKNRFVYDGTIENGMDFVKIGKDVLKLFRKKKNKTSKAEFKELINAMYDQSFFTKTLKLKPEEVDLFIAYCDSDPKSEIIFDDNDVLKVMTFLMTKNDAFKKLEGVEK